MKIPECRQHRGGKERYSISTIPCFPRTISSVYFKTAEELLLRDTGRETRRFHGGSDSWWPSCNFSGFFKNEQTMMCCSCCQGYMVLAKLGRAVLSKYI
jgi:hypothetical protein